VTLRRGEAGVKVATPKRTSRELLNRMLGFGCPVADGGGRAWNLELLVSV
jgi:hypothetical protein